MMDHPGAFILGVGVASLIHAARDFVCLFIGALVVTDRPNLTTTCGLFSYY
jgi:hypothetical protein